MPELNYEKVEESLRRAHRRSLGRFLIFLGFVLVLWIATYVVTKGQFGFAVREKKIAIYDTIVVHQDSALAARDSVIADLKKINALLQSPPSPPDKTTHKHDSLKASVPVPREIIILKEQVKVREELSRAHDTEIKKIRNKEFILQNQPVQQQIKK